jgi:hypothetical protein
VIWRVLYWAIVLGFFIQGLLYKLGRLWMERHGITRDVDTPWYERWNRWLEGERHE